MPRRDERGLERAGQAADGAENAAEEAADEAADLSDEARDRPSDVAGIDTQMGAEAEVDREATGDLIDFRAGQFTHRLEFRHFVLPIGLVGIEIAAAAGATHATTMRAPKSGHGAFS